MRCSDWSSDVCTSDLRTSGSDRVEAAMPERTVAVVKASLSRHDPYQVQRVYLSPRRAQTPPLRGELNHARRRGERAAAAAMVARTQVPVGRAADTQPPRY